MEYKELNRMFDQVKLSPEREEAILADLLRGKEEAASMKENRRRRIPAAALAAAILVVILAGTALAAEYWGKVEIKFVDNVIGSKEGYFAVGPGASIPADSLSEEVLAICADLGAMDTACIPFDSWSEAEAYLGVELADNAVLDRLVKTYGMQYEETTPKGRPVKRMTQCLLRVDANARKHLPSRITLDASYAKGNCSVNQLVQLLTDAVENDYKTGLGAAFKENPSFQDYTTPSGLEVTICSDVIKIRNNLSYTTYSAYFVKNGAFFTLQLMSSEDWHPDQYAQTYDPWDTLIEILDAYE